MKARVFPARLELEVSLNVEDDQFMVQNRWDLHLDIRRSDCHLGFMPGNQAPYSARLHPIGSRTRSTYSGSGTNSQIRPFIIMGLVKLTR